ncbi:MAG: methylated-DNA--[protein]-cysteine S-methyltransferase [Afipia sp.]|nr:methylated-DNA--[protein]-cysteine S-methyltransferase [Afipia sp.]
MMTGFALFDTAIGRCGVAWGERGLLGVQLPEGDDARTRARLLQKAPGAREAMPPEHVQRACDAMTELLDGQAADLSFIALDTDHLPAFNRSVYDIARTIAPGETLTYGDIATRLGDKLLSRAVGKALGENPLPIVIPCHRVLAANGKTGGFSANGGVTTKFRMLTIERAKIANASGDAPMLFDPGLSIAPRGRRG